MQLRRGATVVLSCALAIAPLVGVASTQASPAPPDPSGHHLLPGRTKGAAALRALGDRVPQAAALNHLSTAKFTSILRTDSTANLDADGRMFYAEPAPRAAGRIQSPTATTAPAATAPATIAAAGLAIPALHSHPGSTHSIFLDFNGATVSSGSAWAAPGPGAIPAGDYTGFTLDGDPSTYTSDEVAFMTKVWRIVSEKYAPFDVDVTTVDPGAAGYSRDQSGTDTNYGDHVVITDDSRPVNDVCGGNCAGVAYIGTFNLSGNAAYDPSAWVFSSKAFGSAQMVAHDAAHEIGHTFGLSHDGLTTTPGDNYYSGQANWVPIMGITDQNAVAQFSKGEYTNANNNEDDLAIIGANGNNGAADSLLLPDDYGTTGGAPTPLGDHPSYALDGIISNAADDDLFSIDRTCTGALTATATGIGSGQSLDLKVDILDSSNNVLASDDPGSGQTGQSGDIAYLPTGMDATASLPSTTASTTYRIRVDGVGHADPAVDGYSAYGSIGGYHLTITGCPGTTSAPSAPASLSAVPDSRATTGTVTWTAPASDGGATVTNYKVSGLPGGPVTLGNVLSYPATGLTPGVTYDVGVQAINSNGPGPAALTTLRVLTWAPTTRPGLVVTRSGTTATLHWTAPSDPGGGAITLTGWHVLGSGAGAAINTTLPPTTFAKSFSGLAVGTHTFTVTGIWSADDTTGVLPSNPQSIAVPVLKPSAPRIGTASPGAAGGTSTAIARWAAPLSNGGGAILHYRVFAYKIVGGRVVRITLSRLLAGSARAFTFALPKGSYKFRVVAYNSAGASPYSAYSRVVAAR